MGHCTSDNLLNHFNSFMKDLNCDCNHLIQVGMDDPNVNLSLEKKLRSIMETTYETSFLNFGTCSLHPLHTAFREGIKKLDFDVDEFFYDNFFFKHSSARRGDYASLEETTEMAARYALQHSETRWLSMKYVAVRIMQQWKNLKEYFLKFCPNKVILSMQWQPRLDISVFVQRYRIPCTKHISAFVHSLLRCLKIF